MKHSMKGCTAGIAALLLTLALAGHARAGVITYQLTDLGTFAGYSVADTGQTYSGTGFVGMYSNEFAHLFGLEQNNFSKTAMEVDISALSGMTVTSAVLSFDILDGVFATENVTLTSFGANGSLGHFWTPPSNLGSGTYAVTGHASNALDVTSFLQGRVAANASWLGLHLEGSNQNEWTYTWSGVNRNADSANVRLTVTYSDPAAPEPASLTLLTLGALGASGYAWRRRKPRAARS
jgi:hypothetical protein